MTELSINPQILRSFQSILKDIAKECKKRKDIKEEALKFDKELQLILQQYSAALNVSVGRETISNTIYLTLLMYKSDTTFKLLDKICIQIDEIYSQTNLFSEIQSSEISLTQQKKSITQYLLEKTMQIMDEIKFQKQACKIFNAIIMYSNDIHLQDQKNLYFALMKISMSPTDGQEAQKVLFLNIQILSQKYYITEDNKNMFKNIIDPQNEEPHLLPTLYYNDYKTYLMDLGNQLEQINSLMNHQLPMEQFKQKMRFIDYNQINWFENVTQLLMENIYWLLTFIPVDAIYDQKLFKYFKKLYLEMLDYVILTTKWSLQESFLTLIELFLEIFFPVLDNQFIFEHFNNFVICIINCDEIPHYQLKGALIIHLVRLLCSDKNPEFIVMSRVSDKREYSQKYKLVDLLNMENCTDTQHKQYFELIQRRCITPGFWLQYLFVNFDCQFTQPNLVMMIFDCLNRAQQSIQQSNAQPKNNQITYDLYKDIQLTRRYAGKANKIIQEVKSRIQDTQSEMSQNLNDFSHACGILWNEGAETINKGFEGLNTDIFKACTYQECLLLGISRIMAELYRSYLLFLFQQQEKLYFNYGIPVKNLQETEATLQQKTLMQIGYDKFNNKDSSPLRAIGHFEQIGYIKPLKKRNENEEIVLDDQMMQYYNAFLEQERIEKQNQEQNIPKKRVKRNFEQEYDWNMQQIAGFLAQYANCDEYYYDVIDFYLKYCKKSEFSVGLDKAGFGELIGGSKIENKAFLYYYTQYFIKKYLDTIEDDHLSFVQALRTYLEAFKLPGEGQVIDRILSFFSKACSDRIKIDHRTTHGLSFAVIMLNTDLHNQSIKDARMTKSVFIANTKRIDLEKQLSDEYLGTIYDEIYANPFTLNEIESIKKYFTIIAKYIKIDEKKEQTDASSQQQEKTPEDDKETEFLKSLAPVQRYSKALIDWVHYKSTYYNTSNQEGMLEKQNMEFSFNIPLFKQLFIIIDETRCLSIVCNAVKHRLQGIMPMLLHCMKVVLLVILNKDLGLNDLACKYLKLYIATSHFLKCIIIQFDKFQEQRLTLAVVDADQNEKQKRTEQRDNYVMGNQQIEIINFILEIVRQKLKEQKPEVCYSGDLFLGDAWRLIMPVISRVQYYQCLQQKTTPVYRTITGAPVSEFKRALLQDIEEAWTRHGIPPGVQQNVANIITSFRQGSFQIVQDFQMSTGTQDMDEFPWLLQGLSETSQIELQISIQPDYCLFSENIMTAVYLFLLYANKKMFVECYCNTFNHYEKILIDKKGEIAVRGFSNASKIVSVFINQQMQIQQSKNDNDQFKNESNIDSNSLRIWDTIFQPLQYCLLSENVQLLFNLINRIEEQLKCIKINEVQFKKLKDIIKEQEKISDKSKIEEFITTYSVSLEGVKFPKTSFIQLLQIFNKSVNIFMQKALETIMKAGMNVSSNSLHQKLTHEYKCIIENINKITKNLEGIIILQTYSITGKNQCQINNNETQLINVLISITSQIVKQDIWIDYSLATQESSIKFINLLMTMLFTTSNFTKYEQNDGNNSSLTRLYHLVADTIVSMCNDSRIKQFQNAKQQVQQMLCYLLHNKSGMKEMKEFMELLLCDHFINDFQKTQNSLMNSCKNIENDQFICDDFEHRDQHCLTEMILESLFVDTNEYTLELQKSVFQTYLNVHCKIKSSSIYNILLYMVQQLIKQNQYMFVLNTLKEQLTNVNQIVYGYNFLMVLADVLKYASHTDIYSEILIFAANTYCVMQELQQVHYDVIQKLDENLTGTEKSYSGQFTQKETNEIIYADTYKWLKIIYSTVLKQFLNSSLQTNQNLINAIIKLIQFFATEEQAIEKPTYITLEFLKDLNEDLYEKYFKVPLYESLLILLVEGNEKDIRIDICYILRTRYPASSTAILEHNQISNNFKGKQSVCNEIDISLQDNYSNVQKDDIIDSVSNCMDHNDVIDARQASEQHLNESTEQNETTHHSKSDEIEKVAYNDPQAIICASETDLNNIAIVNPSTQLDSVTDHQFEFTKSNNELAENDNTDGL